MYIVVCVVVIASWSATLTTTLIAILVVNLWNFRIGWIGISPLEKIY